MQQSQNIFAKIPPIQEIDQYLESQGMKSGREVRSQIQTLLLGIRENIDWLSEKDTTRESILKKIKTSLQQGTLGLVPVINGTGAIIHTNLGRSVFSGELFKDIIELGTSYTNLEFSLETGKRGARLSNVGGLLKTLTGAEESVVVNNNAAAVLLTLITLAKDKEVVISRGELVEIGGSFRIPEVISVSGAKLVEVGATNRTRVKDYKQAITDQTAILLKVHTSNYQILGFTESVSTSSLSTLARENDKILVEDLGSGALTSFINSKLHSEPTVSQVLKDGVDIVTISGDKLLGGPQAGIILGKKKYLDLIKQHPLYRALRCDKLTMILLEKTLAFYAKNQHCGQIPTQRMLEEKPEEVKKRAELIVSNLGSDIFKLVKCESTPGGGSMPGVTIPSWGIMIESEKKEEQLLYDLRSSRPPVIGRIIDGKVVIDCRTVLPHQIDPLKKVLKIVSKV